MPMHRTLGQKEVLLTVLVVLIFATGCIYPFAEGGSPYQTADHYWPMHNLTGRHLEDVQGAAETVVYGAKLIPVTQLNSALQLDGKDDWVDTGMTKKNPYHLEMRLCKD